MSPVHYLEELPLVMSVKMVALTLGVSDKTAYKLVQRGELPAVRVGARQAIRITRPALSAYLGLTEVDRLLSLPEDTGGESEQDHRR